jgi:hypothetical protein
MSTRALIIGKSKDGQYHYGQTHYDGMDNLEWLQKHMSDVDKVEEFLHYMTEGCADGGEGHGISSLWYEGKQTGDGFFGRVEYDYDKPIVNWYEEGYNCGISKTKKAILEMKKQGYFDFPEYISYWDGKKWKNIR